METAGITLATDRLDRLPTLLRIGKETMKVVKLNIAFAMLVNFLGITLSIMGIVTPLMASLIHESNAMIVMLNALRLLRVD
jgi:Cd2+/Zn2+-exporting ATPase